MTTPAPCFVCGVTLAEVAEEGINQPDGAMAFVSHGQYGTTFFDEMDGSWLELNICDRCLEERKTRILLGKQYAPRLPPRPKPIYRPYVTEVGT